ncbi:tigger transposable element-derived protein 4-like protein, partial [Leptotrombidium deliense]
MKPRCFKNVNLKNIGIKYYANKNAWMTAKIFQDMIKILIIIDNASSHNTFSLELKNIEFLFLPPNVTCKLQPLDLGVIAALKLKYRTRFVKFLIQSYETDILKQKLDLLTAVKYVVESWTDVSNETIVNCWKKSSLIKYETNIICENEVEEKE